jgi:hypothetical protein
VQDKRADVAERHCGGRGGGGCESGSGRVRAVSGRSLFSAGRQRQQRHDPSLACLLGFLEAELRTLEIALRANQGRSRRCSKAVWNGRISLVEHQLDNLDVALVLRDLIIIQVLHLCDAYFGLSGLEALLPPTNNID